MIFETGLRPCLRHLYDILCDTHGFSELCERTRSEAFEMMLRHAEEMGANAVIGVRYDATEVMDTVSEVLCYGTAVIVQPQTTPQQV